MSHSLKLKLGVKLNVLLSDDEGCVTKRSVSFETPDEETGNNLDEESSQSTLALTSYCHSQTQAEDSTTSCSKLCCDLVSVSPQPCQTKDQHANYF